MCSADEFRLLIYLLRITRVSLAIFCPTRIFLSDCIAEALVPLMGLSQINSGARTVSKIINQIVFCSPYGCREPFVKAPLAEYFSDCLR